MLETIREYLAHEFECDVFDSSDAAGDAADRVLTFTFRRVTYTVVVSAALLQRPPRDVHAFLTDGETALAEAVMMSDGLPVVIDPAGFRILETATAVVQ